MTKTFETEFGPNDWLAEEMLERFRDDPSSVPDSWRLYFERQDIHPRFHNSTVTDAVARESGASELAFDRPGSDQGASMLQPSNGVASSVSQQVGVAGVPSSEGAPEVTVQPGSSRIETSGTATNGVASSRVEASSELIGAGSTNGTASADFASSTGAERSGALADEGTPRGSSSVQPQAEPAGEATLVPLRGAAKALATNMDQSLAVPTATSVRVIPAKALEVNRGIINAQLARQNRPKVSFGHLITYAIVRALVRHPRMYSAFVPGDQPALKEFAHINLGIAVDLVRPDGQRTLLVPVLREAETLDPRAFFEAYDRTIARVREQKATVEDFVGASVSVTNPGTLGTEHSVPRLMQGQGAIIGVGAIELPAEFKATDPRTLAELGISKTVTITSTYDHRIIQGAESGQFLADLSRLLTGEDGFYEEIFRSLDIAYPPTVWRPDSGSIGSSPEERALKQIRVHALINNYRERGHLLANLDPLDLAKPVMSPELDPATYGLTLWDLSRRFLTDGLAGTTELELAEILQILRDTYCGSIGFEYMHIQNPEEKRWLQRRIEGAQVQLTKEEQLRILRTLNDAEAFEKFLSTRYIGQKRFGLEGAESAIVFLTETLNEASRANVTEAVIGMAHRGRLNVLANIVGKSYRTIFEEFEGNLDPNSVQGSGDVKYHKGFSGTYVTSEGTEMPVTLASNPSHLEAVDGVVEGMVRAKQDLRGNLFEFGVLGILVHGDASFAGQGVVAETLNLSQLPGYRTGGTVHLVINNQVGFTTDPKEARSSVYASDLAKTIEAPIMHVNGDDPEAVLRCARLAVAYREAFHKDVVVDMVCYRRHGHNEGDEPSYTQPVMYRVIEHTESVRKKYLAHLVRSRAITEEEGEEALDAYLARLQQALTETREAAPPKPTSLPAAPRQNVPVEPVATAVAREWIDYLFGVLDRVPESFHLHPKLARQFAGRRELFESGEVDWALGEAFAFGTVLLEGRDIRMSGQDTRRGTFSHRHAALYDYDTGERYLPLETVREDPAAPVRGERPGRFMIYDSLLSEYAVMAFEYGYSLAHPRALTIWEAQFGDFANGAQIVIDQFIAAAHDKWGQDSGLVLFLPHGYEGQGPEHSSARLERFLSLAAGPNLQIVNATTAAQFFHLLRGQALRRERRPLVVLTPKSLLRAKQSRSRIDELTSGGFSVLIDDPEIERGMARHQVTRVVLCSGKIAYEALAERERRGATGVAIVRVEQLYPWPDRELSALLASYPAMEELVWLQEEPENMGAWPFVHNLIHRLQGERIRVAHISRVANGSPATGSAAMHALEQSDLLERAVAKPLPESLRRS